MDAQDEMLQREAQEWLLRLTSGNVTVADAEALKRWCARSKTHAQAFAEASLLWENLARRRVACRTRTCWDMAVAATRR
ncbi:FecR/PupR family sigma factor regulator [Mesorhizobium amorphae]|uniref:FecR/PupR family sigma factor regulator n=1 Tax=Mesorhizobium amorphae TaxID=71433 RepID=UPI0021B3FC37|nr:DUF4880 domain-containing protein [Mesorhizobium amorphae]